MKSYASGDKEYFTNLIFQTSKFSFFLLLLISLPFLLECEFVLSIWLKEVPQHAVQFTQLMLIFLVIDAISAPLWISVQAIGNIRNYQLLMSFLILLNLPFSYLVLHQGYEPEKVLIIRVIINLITFLVRIVYLKRRISFPANKYIKEVLGVIVLVLILSIPIPMWVNQLYPSWKGFILTTITSILCVSVITFLIGLTYVEKVYVRNIIRNKFKR